MGSRRIFLRNIGLFASSGFLLSPGLLMASENSTNTKEGKVISDFDGYLSESDIFGVILAMIDKNDVKGLNDLLT